MCGGPQKMVRCTEQGLAQNLVSAWGFCSLIVLSRVEAAQAGVGVPHPFPALQTVALAGWTGPTCAISHVAPPSERVHHF